MRIVFGDCELDSDRRLLLRHGRPTPLSPKAFQLLELLVDRRPEAVAKSELLDHLWADVFVSDASLHNLVAEIRAALGDNPRAARYIRTVPRFGYAFQADARSVARDIPNTQSSGPRVVSGNREWVLAQGSNLVGRDRGCSIWIDSPTLSRRHACIVVDGVAATLEDLGSKNGTYLNRHPVTQPLVLHDGDRIQVGSVEMTYHPEATLPSTITRHI
jgi:DNA-binding winged helix-turn-helix (wHTH) protein